MADITLKMRADALGKSLENLSKRVDAELKNAIGTLAGSAYIAMQARIQSSTMPPKNREAYLKGLKFTQIGDNEYVIYLEGELANKIEKGMSAWDMNDVLLKSDKIVQVGSRAGQPWVRTAKDGHKYAAVPFQHKPFSKDPGRNALGDQIKEIYVANPFGGPNQKITQIFKDIDGNPVAGKVATASEFDTPIKNLQGLTKYQYVNPSGSVSSVYMTYRMISETGKRWKNPGMPGIHLFDETEKYIQAEMDNIIKRLIE